MEESPFAPDPAVDYGLPIGVSLYSVFNEQEVEYAEVFVGDALGARKIVRLKESIRGGLTGRVVEFWHIDKILVHGVVKGRKKVARSGKSGTKAPHVHLVMIENGKRIDPTFYILQAFGMANISDKEVLAFGKIRSDLAKAGIETPDQIREWWAANGWAELVNQTKLVKRVDKENKNLAIKLLELTEDIEEYKSTIRDLSLKLEVLQLDFETYKQNHPVEVPDVESKESFIVRLLKFLSNIR